MQPLPSHFHFPPAFRERMRRQLAGSYSDFEQIFSAPAPVSVRNNPAKLTDLPFLNTEPVAWRPYGYYLPHRPAFTLDPLFHAGGYYVQEASSMLIGTAFPQTDEPILVLDLCAAPGGKTTLLASLLNEKSLLIANEVIKTRKPILDENVFKWGVPNVITASADSSEWVRSGIKFDFILADAPCSGEGLWRKQPEAINEWSEELLTLCSERQKRILTDAVRLLKPGGRLLYSTCTYNPGENEENILFLIHNYGLKPVSIPKVKVEWGVLPTEEGGYICYPHRVKGEGFFFCLLEKSAEDCEENDLQPLKTKFSTVSKEIQKMINPYVRFSERMVFTEKNGEIRAVPAAWAEDIFLFESKIRKLTAGTPVGMLKGKDFIPTHEWALSTECNAEPFALKVDLETALRFLKKELSDIPHANPGWHLLTYEGLALGWLKKIKGRINNYLPSSFRIRMDVDYKNL